MTFDFRYPQLTGATEKEQLQQLKTYMHQLVDELKWALNSVDSPQSNVVVIQQKQSNANSGVGTIGLDEFDEDSVQAHFNEIKPLIIKSADIVNAYYEEISKRLEGIYVAQSDFGTYTQETAQEIEANSTDITQNFTNVQQIINSNVDLMSKEIGTIDNDLQGVKESVEGDIKDLSDEVVKVDSKIDEAKSALSSDLDKLKDSLNALNSIIVEVNAHIKSGILDYDNGIPVYGIEVGQTNTINGVEVFNKFARFTAGRLSFYDNNGTEVAYISDYKLYITHAEVTGTLKLGGYLVDTSNGVTFKWVGRS